MFGKGGEGAGGNIMWAEKGTGWEEKLGVIKVLMLLHVLHTEIK